MKQKIKKLRTTKTRRPIKSKNGKFLQETKKKQKTNLNKSKKLTGVKLLKYLLSTQQKPNNIYLSLQFIWNHTYRNI